MKADFDTLATLFGLLLNSAVLATLSSLLNRKEAEEIIAELKEALAPNRGDDQPDDAYVTNKLKPLQAQLRSVWLWLLHLLNAGILAALATILIIGPEKVFLKAEGELAEPLTQAQLIAYWIWFFINLVLYVIQGVSPTFQWWRLSRRAQTWLKEYEARHPRRRS